MWSPTHVQVVVQRAKGLITKGKNKSNDCFVTIALGKEKYQTSVKEKASENVEWHEECELQIPQRGNTAEIVLTALHRNFLGVDEFLGTVRIPLADFDVYEMPKNRWYELSGKPGKESSKERGRLEVRIGFIVRAGSLSDLSKKDQRHKGSLGQLTSAAQSFGGSLLSIGSVDKRKGLKKLAKSIGSKVKGVGGSGGSGGSGKSRRGGGKGRLDDICDEDEFRTPAGLGQQRPRTAGQEQGGDADPGVVSDEEDDFTFDDLSHKSSTSSLNSSAAAPNQQQQQQQQQHHQQQQTNSPSSSATIGTRTNSSSPQPIAGPRSTASSAAADSPVVGGGQHQRRRLDSGSSSAGGQSSPRPATRGEAAAAAAGNAGTTTSTSAAMITTPPSKPPRFGLAGSGVSPEADKRGGPADRGSGGSALEDEWGQKLYGLQAGNALKRWENKRMSPKIVVDESRDAAAAANDAAHQPTAAPSPRSSPVSRLRGEVSASVESLQSSAARRIQPLLRKDGKDKYKVSSLKDQLQQQQQYAAEKPDKRSKDRIFPRLHGERIIIGGEERKSESRDGGVGGTGPGGGGLGLGGAQSGRLPPEIAEQFEGKSREDLIEMVLNLQFDVADKKKRLHDLEDYIDALLLRVIECSPRLLQNPYQPTRRLSSPGNQ